MSGRKEQEQEQRCSSSRGRFAVVRRRITVASVSTGSSNRGDRAPRWPGSLDRTTAVRGSTPTPPSGCFWRVRHAWHRAGSTSDTRSRCARSTDHRPAGGSRGVSERGPSQDPPVDWLRASRGSAGPFLADPDRAALGDAVLRSGFAPRRAPGPDGRAGDGRDAACRSCDPGYGLAPNDQTARAVPSRRRAWRTARGRGASASWRTSRPSSALCENAPPGAKQSSRSTPDTDGASTARTPPQERLTDGTEPCDAAVRP